ncbi:hypothetical protein PHLCEN_2v10064 [Hermanssonia centrifuga]|uniref:Heat shock protein 30 n=1 Tax=Hermanssonia centrifuga TaxID=98765 RepID=A0A2R6NNU9_9APHY|nr:hypothetical protein PHLCEN_2v10064 [Hermanssonia centrifuga]
MGNEALNLNPPNADYHLTTNGSDWLWTAFSIFGLSLLVMVVLDFMRPRGTRLFHQLAIIILATLSISYFSMASDLGATPIEAEFRGFGTRQIWYVRYIQWFITYPLLLLELLLATGLSLSDIVTTLFMSIVFVVSLLVGALVHSDYKWGYYVFAVVALFYIWLVTESSSHIPGLPSHSSDLNRYVLLWYAPHATFAESNVLRSTYLAGASYFSFVLLTYPIAWACAEGGNVISVTSEMIWYGILDIFLGPVFLFFFLWKLREVEYSAFGFRSGKYTDQGGIAEKGAAPTAPVPEATQ